MNIVEHAAHGFDIDVVEEQEFPHAEYRISIIPDEGSHTTHLVTLDEQYWQELTSGKMSGQDLIEATFEYLLNIEENEAIMPRFDLRDIAEYYPEFENNIRQSL